MILIEYYLFLHTQKWSQAYDCFLFSDILFIWLFNLLADYYPWELITDLRIHESSLNFFFIRYELNLHVIVDIPFFWLVSEFRSNLCWSEGGDRSLFVKLILITEALGIFFKHIFISFLGEVSLSRNPTVDENLLRQLFHDFWHLSLF